MLYPIGAVCVLAILILTGVREHSASSSYLATGGGQTYVISVGGDQAATIPTPTVQPQATSYTVVASPSVQADFINRVLLTYHSPAAGKGQALYDLGVEHGIDPAFALAFFMHESTFGTRGEATKSRSLGNLRCIPNFRCEDNFAQFNTWEDGFKAWYQLIGNLYVAQWKLTTVDQIIPKYAPTADHNNEQAYIAALKYAVDTWHTGQYIVR